LVVFAIWPADDAVLGNTKGWSVFKNTALINVSAYQSLEKQYVEARTDKIKSDLREKSSNCPQITAINGRQQT
jgi:hypothetical protein